MLHEPIKYVLGGTVYFVLEQERLKQKKKYQITPSLKKKKIRGYKLPNLLVFSPTSCFNYCD